MCWSFSIVKFSFEQHVMDGNRNDSDQDDSDAERLFVVGVPEHMTALSIAGGISRSSATRHDARSLISALSIGDGHRYV